jgi:uncharacterized membrane protein SpoIIM required for sporulation/ABC-type transport system involved in multi-copper enzyme maturation permease subunit
MTIIANPPGELRQTLSNALIITRREVRDSFRDWRILGPIVTLTFVFPFLAQFVASRFAGFVAGYGAEIIGERTIPFLLMIVGFFPISISLVIALETFVGEKERRSLEPLLSTPLTNTELYIGKTLAAMIPPLVSSYGGMIVYLGSLLFGELAWRPPAMLIVQIILLTTVQALVMVTGAVVVSSQTTSTRAANLLASFIVIPMTFLIQGESAVMFLAPDADSPKGISALWAIIVGMMVVVILLLRVGNSIFNREELLGRTIDQLKIRGTFANIWRWTRAVNDDGTPARHLLDWYQRGMLFSLRRLRVAGTITIGVFLLAFIGGYGIGQLPQWRLPLPQAGEYSRASNVIGAYLGVSVLETTFSGGDTHVPAAMPSQSGVLTMIIWQNARILLAATALSVFTFGAAALVLTPAVYVILGYAFSQIVLAGYNPGFLIAATFTHGIIEIPVIVLAAAAALRLGAVITRPPQGVTVGNALVMALGDTLKVGLGIILPGLIIAGCIEAFITPRVVLMVLGG